jgi:Zn-dependent protease
MIFGITTEDLIIYIISILIAMSVHEAMHAFVGYKLGDTTALDQGRVSLNPLKHIDPFTSIALPLITLLIFHVPILAAKPVPFNPARLKFDEYGAALVAAAGPVSNLGMAIIGAILIKFTGAGSLAEHAIGIFVTLNVALFVFNLIPIPPLDGSRVLYAFAPDALRGLMEQIEPIGMFIVFGFVLLGGATASNILLNLNQFVLNLLP